MKHVIFGPQSKRWLLKTENSDKLWYLLENTLKEIDIADTTTSFLSACSFLWQIMLKCFYFHTLARLNQNHEFLYQPLSYHKNTLSIRKRIGEIGWCGIKIMEQLSNINFTAGFLFIEEIQWVKNQSSRYFGINRILKYEIPASSNLKSHLIIS